MFGIEKVVFKLVEAIGKKLSETDLIHGIVKYQVYKYEMTIFFPKKTR